MYPHFRMNAEEMPQLLNFQLLNRPIQDGVDSTLLQNLSEAVTIISDSVIYIIL